MIHDLNDPVVASDLQVARLAERCRDDLERRWRAGERIVVDEYFKQFPALLEDSESSLLLIYSEFLLRERFGEPSSAADFYQRFPAFAKELQAQFQLHSVLGFESFTADAPPLAATEPACETDLDLFEEIGRGGMGIVLRGHDRVLDRELAVKVLRPGQLEERFFSEARIGGRLQHPGIVPVHQFGRLEDGRPFFTMKLVEGSTLASLLAERSNPQHRQSEFIRIFEKVCQTVAYAHERGVIHRDLKPANIMVGRFGEVQVMDWGLSKFLGASAATGTEARTSRRDVLPDFTSSTQTGAIIGTLGYMAPEQARADAVPDARTDVFGLGAILCEILTGQPPFSGADRAELLDKTTRGELTDARERIDRCGADSDLINLTNRCLAAEPAQRPAHAGEVATAIANSFAGAEARLRTVELERAAAQARSLADRRARRLTASLAVAGVAFAMLLALGTILYFQNRERRIAEAERKTALAEQEIQAQLQKAADLDHRARELVNDPPRWEAAMAGALAAVRQASNFARAEGIDISPDLQRQVDAATAMVDEDERDRQLLVQLEAIRMVPYGIFDESKASDRMRTAPKYRAAFVARGLDAPGASIDEATAWLTRRPPTVRAAMAGMLDDWLTSYPYGGTDPTAVWLRTVLRAVETDPWMCEIRDIRNRPKLAAEDLGRLANQADLTAHPPAAYYLLAMDLSGAGDPKKAIAFLQRAQYHHPGDFWVNFFLGRLLQAEKLEMEAVRYYLAARVARPNDPRLLVNLGNVLHRIRDPDGAEEVFRQAQAIDPKLFAAHIGLGFVRRAKGDLPGALEHYLHAIDLDPTHPFCHQGLANILVELHDPAGAIASCERALKLDPRMDTAYSTWGAALMDQKNFSGAAIAWRRAIELKPHEKLYHEALGTALKAQNDLTGAANAFRRTTELDPSDADGFKNLGECMLLLGEWNHAAAAFRTATTLAPGNAPCYANLGVCLRQLKDFQGSIIAFTRACELNDRSSWTHMQLAFTYRDLNDLQRSLAELKRAVEIEPKNYDRQFALARGFASLGQYEHAEGVYRRCLELSPQNPQAHCNLGLALRDQGKFAEAVECLRRGHDLGTRQKGWTYPSERWLKDCEVLRELDKKMPDASAASAAEQFELAKLTARYRRNYSEATRLAGESFAKEPNLTKSRGLEASRWAIRAAESSKSEQDRLAFNRQSREWLQAGIDGATPTAEVLKNWKDLLHAPEFAVVRDDALLFKLTESERNAWRKLWDEVRGKIECDLLPKN